MLNLTKEIIELARVEEKIAGKMQKSPRTPSGLVVLKPTFPEIIFYPHQLFKDNQRASILAAQNRVIEGLGSGGVWFEHRYLPLGDKIKAWVYHQLFDRDGPEHYRDVNTLTVGVHSDLETEEAVIRETGRDPNNIFPLRTRYQFLTSGEALKTIYVPAAVEVSGRWGYEPYSDKTWKAVEAKMTRRDITLAIRAHNVLLSALDNPFRIRG